MKKIISLVLAVMMVLSFSACSGNSSGSAKAFKLGASGPLTGDAAEYGLAVRNAAGIAVEEINAKGGIQFEFNMQDDQADGEKATAAYNALMDWGMQVSLLTVTSGAGQAVAPLFKQDKVFGLTPSGSSVAIIYQNVDAQSDPYGNLFQMCFTDPNQGVASAEYLKAHAELGSKVGIIYRSDDNYSTGIYQKFKAAAQTAGLEIVSEQTFTNGATDYSVQVGKCQEAGADVVFLPIYYQPASQILTEANAKGYKPTFFGCDGMDGILAMEGFDTALAEGLFMLTPFSADAEDELTKNFVAKYKEKYGVIPNQFAADAYDAVYAIAQAIEASGVKPTDATADITEKLVKQFTGMTFSGLTGTGVTWNASGEVSKSPKAIMIRDGQYVSYGD